MNDKNGLKYKVIVGGGFAGGGGVPRLASQKAERVTLIGKNNYQSGAGQGEKT
jgi:NADH dehydrogenase FAD-containing subunit